MATQSIKMKGSGYGNPYIVVLVWGGKWLNGSVTYSFGPAGYNLDGENSLIFTEAEKLLFKQVFQAYSNVCKLSFKEVPFALNSKSNNIVEWKFDELSSEPGYITLGWHEVPDNKYIQNWGAFSTAGDYWSTSMGSLGYATVVHELGHAIGLAHPHDGGDRVDATLFPGVTEAFDSYGTYSLNQGIWTVMSYNRGWATDMPPTDWSYGDVITPMALDIAALQKIYGANTSFKTGGDTYFLPTSNVAGTGWACIWDAGGVDTLSAGETSSACFIDLNPAPLVGPNAGGYVSRIDGIYGGYTIANGVTIENAQGGGGNDLLTGNSANNILKGESGNDHLLGGSGNDVIYGGEGADTLIGGLGKDVLYGGSGSDVFVFDSISESKIKYSFRDVIVDFSAGDKIDLSGIDAKSGLTSNDEFSFLGSALPTKANANGALWFVKGVLYGSTDTDISSEFEIAITGVLSMLAGDFFL